MTFGFDKTLDRMICIKDCLERKRPILEDDGLGNRYAADALPFNSSDNMCHHGPFQLM